MSNILDRQRRPGGPAAAALESPSKASASSSILSSLSSLSTSTQTHHAPPSSGQQRILDLYPVVPSGLRSDGQDDNIPRYRPAQPRFRRPFRIPDERLFMQDVKPIGHAQEAKPTVNPLEDLVLGTDPVYQRPPPADDTLALLLPLLILLSTLLFLLLLFIILIIVVRRRARIALTDSDGPLDVGREEELEGTGGLDGLEQRWLESQDDTIRRGYRRAKDWTLAYPPNTQSTDITLSQFLSIQEKGVSAWSFDPDYESNPSVFVEARTEITFLADGEGMAPQEGGGVCVQSNLPLPKINEVYYWEVKMFNKPDATNVAVGLTTKPYPQFRMPGWSKYSIGFFSSDGFKCHNYPFAAQSYGPAYGQGDVIGIGYRPRTGSVFFTRNGKRLEDAFIGLNRYNLFPTIGADGACEIHVNLGQAGFVFIEANVKKWGLAPMVGTLAPPPAYGQERGTILMESGQGSSADAATGADAANEPPPPPISPYDERAPSTSAAAHGSRIQSRHLVPPSTRSSSLRQHTVSADNDDGSEGSPPNPPTPHRLDISMHSLSDSSGRASSAVEDSYFPASPPSPVEPLPSTASSSQQTHSPPSYAVAVSHGSLGGTPASNHQARRGSGRTHQIANAVLGMLSDRGLLTPLNHTNPSPQPSPGSENRGFGSYGSGFGGGLSEAEYERMLRANTARNSRTTSSDDTPQANTASSSSSSDYSIQGWVRWLGVRGSTS